MIIEGNVIKGVKFVKSPNVGGNIKDHKYIIIHYTASESASSAIGWMVSSESKVSAHLHIDREGEIVQLVGFDKVAWHAGASFWKGINGLNSYSVGIELQNTGNQEYTEKQLEACKDVCELLVSRYGFEEILGHSDIAPGRKTDPGKHFPMEWLRSEVYRVVSTKKTTSALNLRSGAGTNFSSLEVLSAGTEVNVLSESNGWSNVFICSTKKTGYVSSKCLK